MSSVKGIPEYELEIKMLSRSLDTFKKFYEQDTKAICRLSVAKADLEKKVEVLEGRVKGWSELAQYNMSAYQNAMTVHSAEESNKAINLWCERALYAKDIIWKLINWIDAPKGWRAGKIADSLPKWVRKEAWGEPD